MIIHADVASPFAAKALAGLEATRLGISMGLTTCSIMGDSRTTIKKCQSLENDRSIIGAFIRDIQNLKPYFQNLEKIILDSVQRAVERNRKRTPD